MDERTQEENQILCKYKWANGFTKKRMNKIQLVLGNGVAWGVGYIIAGYGLILHVVVGGILSIALKNSGYMELITFLAFPIGLLLEAYCEIQRDKITYNEMIDREKQMNLFRDFGIRK